MRVSRSEIVHGTVLAAAAFTAVGTAVATQDTSTIATAAIAVLGLVSAGFAYLWPSSPATAVLQTVVADAPEVATLLSHPAPSAAQIAAVVGATATAEAAKAELPGLLAKETELLATVKAPV